MLTYYVEENQKRLTESYNLFTDYFKKHNIPYTPCCAGLFIWMDLRRFLPKTDSQGKELDGPAAEKELFMRMINDAKLFIAPGAQCESSVLFLVSCWIRM